MVMGSVWSFPFNFYDSLYYTSTLSPGTNQTLALSNPICFYLILPLPHITVGHRRNTVPLTTISQDFHEKLYWLSKFPLKIYVTKPPTPAEVRRLQQGLSHNTMSKPTLNTFETITVTKAFHAPA